MESAVVDYQRFNITATARYAAIITTKTWRARVLVTKKMLRCKKSLLYYRRHKRFCIPALLKISGKLKCCENVTVTELPTTTPTTTTAIPTPTPVLVRRKVCAKCAGNYTWICTCVYYAAVLIGRIAVIARPPVFLAVRLSDMGFCLKNKKNVPNVPRKKQNWFESSSWQK